MKSIDGKMRLAFTALYSLAVLASTVAPLRAEMNAEEVTRRLQDAYGILVLKVQEIADRGGAAFAVTMMNPPGDFNEAYQVNTVVVDRQTGALIPQTRESINGGVDPAPAISRRTSPKTSKTP